jgi:hypothetical protein
MEAQPAQPAQPGQPAEQFQFFDVDNEGAAQPAGPRANERLRLVDLSPVLFPGSTDWAFQ